MGQFEAEMSSDSFQLLGMAERGFLPAILSHRSPHGTPTLAIILSSLGIVALIPFSFLEVNERSLFSESLVLSVVLFFRRLLRWCSKVSCCVVDVRRPLRLSSFLQPFLDWRRCQS